MFKSEISYIITFSQTSIRRPTVEDCMMMLNIVVEVFIVQTTGAALCSILAHQVELETLLHQTLVTVWTRVSVNGDHGDGGEVRLGSAVMLSITH